MSLAIGAAAISTLKAQSSGDIAAFLALSLTPVAALPPVLSPMAPGPSQSSSAFSFRYGRREELNAFAAGFDFARESFSAGLTIGYATCADCDGGTILGGGSIRSRLFSRPMGSSPGSFNVGVSGEIGIGIPTEGGGNAIAGALGLPLSVSLGREWLVVPFVAPLFGFGRVSGDGDSESGGLFMLGAGVGLHPADGDFEVHFGLNRIFIKSDGDEGKTQFGLGLSWLFPRS
jgi:hypothetical protein